MQTSPVLPICTILSRQHPLYSLQLRESSFAFVGNIKLGIKFVSFRFEDLASDVSLDLHSRSQSVFLDRDYMHGISRRASQEALTYKASS